MTFLSWLGDHLLGVVALFSAVVAPVVTIFQIWRTSKVQMKQIRPDVTAHGCRISGLQIYTYFDENNKLAEPACVFLSPDGSHECLFEIEGCVKEEDKKWAERMLQINNGKCYLSLWGQKNK